jgi:peptidoglycan/xylan/chitin deacetylase (PgdA/CDA1 family)
LELFDRYQIPLAILTNTSVYDICPEVLVPFRERGDEFVGHGRTNSERQIDMAENDERSMLAEVRDRFILEEGKPPQGWLGPFISQSPQTPELLLETGYSYMMDWYFDEQPQWFRTDRGPIMTVPYPSMELNDIPAFINRGSSDTDFTRMATDGFDQQLADGERHGWPLVCAISMHTFLMGQPHRARQLKQILEHMAAQRSQVWFATPGQIAAHVAGLPEGMVPKP